MKSLQNSPTLLFWRIGGGGAGHVRCGGSGGAACVPLLGLRFSALSCCTKLLLLLPCELLCKLDLFANDFRLLLLLELLVVDAVGVVCVVVFDDEPFVLVMSMFRIGVGGGGGLITGGRGGATVGRPVQNDAVRKRR